MKNRRSITIETIINGNKITLIRRKVKDNNHYHREWRKLNLERAREINRKSYYKNKYNKK